MKSISETKVRDVQDGILELEAKVVALEAVLDFLANVYPDRKAIRGWIQYEASELREVADRPDLDERQRCKYRLAGLFLEKCMPPAETDRP